MFLLQSVSFVYHVEATESSPTDCGDDGAFNCLLLDHNLVWFDNPQRVSPAKEGFTRLSRLALGLNRMGSLEWNTCLAK